MGLINLPEGAQTILSRLSKCGYESYVVGGCVRDSIIGATPNDWDICTSALPEQIMETFSECKIIPTGLKHGTVTAVLEDGQYEITTYRIDGEYEDNRHPKDVKFTSSLYEDLSRRDFTINAMAYNPDVGLVDFFGGREDIQDRIIRCVGDPNKRFSEDALRMMRAVRFATKLGFEIAEDTAKAIQENKHLIKNISMERINSELVQTLKYGFNPMLIDILGELIEFDRDKIAKIDCQAFSTYMLTDARIAYIFNCVSRNKKLEVGVRNILRFFRFDNKTAEKIFDIGAIAMFDGLLAICDTPRIAVRTILSFNDNVVEDVISIYQYMSIVGDLNITQDFIDQMIDEIDGCKKSCYKVKDLKIDGYDLMNIGYSGKEIGCVLNRLLNDVITERVENNREDLISLLSK